MVNIKARMGLAIAAALLAGGCIFLPSESFYAVGVAKVGDAIFLYAPMCEGERLDRIEVTTEKENPANYDEPFITEHWVAEGPLDSQVENGWIELGADADFADVKVRAGDIRDWPAFVFLRMYQHDEKKAFTTDADYSSDTPIPEYDAGADITTIEFLLHGSSEPNEDQLMTPEEIRDEMGCAIQYF